MNKEWFKLSIYIYNFEAINDVLKKLIDEINKSEKLKHQVMISKKWQFGPHIQMIYSLDEETKIIIEKVVEKLRQYFALHEIPMTQSYEKYEELSNWMTLLEDHKVDTLPLRKHLEITNEEMDLNDISTSIPLEMHVEIEKLLSAFVCDAYGYFDNMDMKSQDSFLMKCMIILGAQKVQNDLVNVDNQTKELELLAKWQKTVSRMLKVYDEMLLNSNISWDEKHMMNAFYTILPLFSVSPLRRNKLCETIGNSYEENIFIHRK